MTTECTTECTTNPHLHTCKYIYSEHNTHSAGDAPVSERKRHRPKSPTTMREPSALHCATRKKCSKHPFLACIAENFELRVPLPSVLLGIVCLLFFFVLRCSLPRTRCAASSVSQNVDVPTRTTSHCWRSWTIRSQSAPEASR